MTGTVAVQGRPQIVAHRGASADFAEHTAGAYRRALEAGAEALECDVRLTADGHLVCVHDRRIDRTSDGHGVVSTLPLEQLRQRDFQSWKQPTVDGEETMAGDLPGSVLTFEELCGMVRDWHRPVQLAVETKHPTRFGSLVERRLAQTLAQFGWDKAPTDGPPPVRVMSFSRTALRRLHERAPAVPTVYLMDRTLLVHRDGSLPLGTRIAGPSLHIVRAHPRYVRRAHDKGHQVHVWIVNEPADLLLCQRLGVDAVITDRPAEASRLLQAPA